MKHGRSVFAFSVFSAFTVVACSVDWAVEPPSTTGDSGLYDIDSATPVTPVTDASSDTSRDVREELDASTFDADAGDEPDGSLVCSPSRACSNGQHCAYADHFCGSGNPGTCVDAENCSGAPAETVCGCDSKLYTSRCAAIAAGADPSAQAPCSTPANKYRCGLLYCGTDDACVITGNGSDFACAPLNGCTLGCACIVISKQCNGGSCAVEQGHVVVRCP